jgi:DNA-binding MarR family transcriptional regulator
MAKVVDPNLLANKPKEALWVRYIQQRIKQNKNFLGFISGSTGSGKSWSSISIAEQLDSDFTDERIVFSGIELMKLINSDKLKKGSVVVFEEAGIGMSSKNWQSTINKMLNFLIQTFRHRNFILIFNSPYMDFVDSSTRKLFHAEFSTVGIDISKGTCRLKPRTIQYNSRTKKFYFKMLRVITKKGLIPVNFWSVGKPSPELIKSYEIKKRAFTDKLNANILKELLEYEKKESNDPIDTLTMSQKEVLDLVEKGLNADQMSEELGIAVQGVRGHISNLRKKGFVIRALRDRNNNNKVIKYLVEKKEEKENED